MGCKYGEMRTAKYAKYAKYAKKMWMQWDANTEPPPGGERVSKGTGVGDA